LSDIQTGKQLAFSVETKENTETIVPVLEKFLGYNLTEQNSSIEFTGPTLSGSFYNELRRALVVAFLLMAVVVFFLFRTFIPSIAVVQAGFTDIIVPLAFVDLIGFKVSTAGIAAFLMLIGYSVDTDILLTNRVLRKEDAPLNSRINSALKTGLTMTITSLVAVLFGYLIVRNISSVLAEIFMILSVGLVTDMISTWFGNAGILKWYCIKKGIK
jgi:preprotein translocase subunit SecF